MKGEKKAFSSKQIQIFGDSNETVLIYELQNFGVNMNLEIFPNLPQMQLKITNELTLQDKFKRSALCSNLSFTVPRILKLKLP